MRWHHGSKVGGGGGKIPRQRLVEWVECHSRTNEHLVGRRNHGRVSLGWWGITREESWSTGGRESVAEIVGKGGNLDSASRCDGVESRRALRTLPTKSTGWAPP